MAVSGLTSFQRPCDNRDTPTNAGRQSLPRSHSPLAATAEPSTLHSHVTNNQGRQGQVLLMTCQVWVMTSEGTTMQARTLLDSVSSMSYIMERLARQLRLLRKNRHVQVAGIGSALHDPLSHTVAFGVSRLWHKEDRRSPHQLWEVEAVVLPKKTAPLPVLPVPFDPRWNHLTGLHLGDRDFGVPGLIEVLLGVNVFSCTFCHNSTYELTMVLKWL